MQADGHSVSGTCHAPPPDAAAAAAAAAVAASSPACWRLLGEGNANVVLAYAGSDARLAGKVLRLRKAPRHKQQQQQQPASQQHLPADDAGAEAAALAALEALVWQPLIPEWARLDAMQRELLFVRRLLAPRLGRCARLAVAEAVVLAPPPALVQQLQAAGCQLADGVQALLLPDLSALPPGQLPPGMGAVGPPVCVEVKPKAGFLPGPRATAVPADSIKRQQPRFVLHQLLKHLKGKSPAMSRYCPLDLFMNQGAPATEQQGQQQQGQQQQPGCAQSSSSSSNQAAGSSSASELLLRQQAALAALLECPFNNLRVFVNGRQVYGGKADVAMAPAAPGGSSSPAGKQPGSHSRLSQRAPACSGGLLASQLQPGESTAAQAVQQPQEGCHVAAPAGSLVPAAGECSGGPPRAPHQQQQQQRRHSPMPSSEGVPIGPPSAASGAAALQRRGSLEAAQQQLAGSPTWRTRRWHVAELLRALPDFPADACAGGLTQSTAGSCSCSCSSSAAAAWPLIASPSPPVLPRALAGLVAPRELALARLLCGALNACGLLPALLELQMLDAADISGVAPVFEALLAEQLATQQQQQQQQHKSDPQQQQQQQQQQDESYLWQQQQQQEQQACGQAATGLSLLRDYLTATTAKDCGIMITLQQLAPAGPAAAARLQQQQQQRQQSSSSCNGLLVDAPSGGCFAWQVGLVDLDLKPLAKVRQHAALDAAILRAAAQHASLLQQHLAGRQRWLRLWLRDGSSSASCEGCDGRPAAEESAAAGACHG